MTRYCSATRAERRLRNSGGRRPAPTTLLAPPYPVGLAGTNMEIQVPEGSAEARWCEDEGACLNVVLDIDVGEVLVEILVREALYEWNCDVSVGCDR